MNAKKTPPTMPLEVTMLEASAIAKGLALLEERMSDPHLREHAPALETLHRKLIAMVASVPDLFAKAQA